MWQGLAITSRLLLAFLIILLRNTVIAKAENTATLTNVSSTVITYPDPNGTLQSSINPETQSSTQLLKVRNTSSFINTLATSTYSIILKELKVVNSTTLPSATEVTPHASEIRGEISSQISLNAKMAYSSVSRVASSEQIETLNTSKVIVVLSMLVQASSTKNKKTSTTLIPETKKDENVTLVTVSPKHSVSLVMSSSVQSKQPTASSSKRAESSVVPAMPGKTNTTHTENEKRSGNFTVPIYVNNSKVMLLSTTPLKPEQSLPISTTARMRQMINITISTAPQKSKSILIRTIATEVTARYSKNISENAGIKTNSTTGISSTEVKQANKTFVLEPSPSLVTKQNRSEFNVIFTSPVVNMTEMLYSKMSKGRIVLTGNYTGVQDSMLKSALLTYNHTSRINATKEKRPGKTITFNESKAIDVEMSNATKTKPIPSKINLENVTKSSPVVKMDNKTMITTPMRYMPSSELYVTSGNLGSANRSLMTSTIPISDRFSQISSNQTQLTNNLTSYGVIRPSSILSSFYKTVTNRTEEIQVSPSIAIVKNVESNYSMHVSDSTNSTRKLKTSDTIVEMKPTSTASFAYSTIEHSTRISTTPTSFPTDLKEQQFAVTIKITSEPFRNEYVTSRRAFSQKSKEVTEQFDQVFKDMWGYADTEVVRFFKGSLGCDVVIYTETVESKPVSVQKIRNTLDQAKATGGFGKFVVGDIDVKEKDTNVQARDEDKDDKETWGRIPIIVISILAGLCLVLLVMVITQCIQKRHYSHSLADSNEIQEYSPGMQLKYNDDGAYKDEERLPMTTFNQTDIY